MSLFSFLRKNKQESASDDSVFYSRAEEDSKAVRSRSKRRQSQQSGQGNSPVDPVLPEKKRARRRLIGAVALVLGAVVGLPMILDSEPKPLADDIAIQIPSKEKAVAPTGMRPAAPASSRISAAASLDPKEEMIELAPVEAKAAPPKAEVADTVSKAGAGSVVENAKPATDITKPVIDKPVADKPPIEKPAVKAETKTMVKAAEKSDDAARAKALLEGKPDPKSTDSKAGKFVIQVAALATKEKVDELQTKLTNAGIKSYTQKVATDAGDRTRIRVGPFASKDEAEKVRAKIIKLGLNGTLVPA